MDNNNLPDDINFGTLPKDADDFDWGLTQQSENTGPYWLMNNTFPVGNDMALPYRATPQFTGPNPLPQLPDAQRMQTTAIYRDYLNNPLPPHLQPQHAAQFGELTNFNAGPLIPGLNGQYQLPTTQPPTQPQPQPQPQAPRAEPSVPLPPLRAPASVAPVTPATGPMSASVTLKRRPKPGRKPIAEDDRVNIRRQQNRQAQRNFRDKRQQKLADTMQELQKNKVNYEKAVCEMRRESALEVEAARKAAKAAMEEVEALKRRYSMEARYQARSSRTADHMRRNPNLAVDTALTTAAPNTYGYNPGQVTPPLDSAMANEMDFTNYGNAMRRRSQRHSRTLSGSSLEGMQVEDMCGFCTDSANCVCRSKMPAPTPASGPGSCEGCQNDPVMKAKCLALFSSSTSQDQTAPADVSTMACAEVLNQMQTTSNETLQAHDVTSMIGMSDLDSYISTNGSGFEIDSYHAARILESIKGNGGR